MRPRPEPTGAMAHPAAPGERTGRHGARRQRGPIGRSGGGPAAGPRREPGRGRRHRARPTARAPQVDRVAAARHAPEARPRRAGRGDRQVPPRARRHPARRAGRADARPARHRDARAGAARPADPRDDRSRHARRRHRCWPSPRSTAPTSSRSATGPAARRRSTASRPARSCCRRSPSGRSCAIVRRGLVSYTERTIVELEPLLEELARIRRRGYATAIGEYELGLNAVAAPVHDARGNVIAAVDIWGPAFRLTPRRIPELAAQAREAAAAISVRLGGAAA